VLFDGLFGELTFSNPLPLHRRESWWRAARHRLRTSAPRPVPAFHVYLAPHWLAQPPAPLRETLQQPASPMRLPEPGALWGVSQGIAKAVRSPASLDLGRVRVAMPFRDPRLIALFAGFPAAMLYPEPGARTPARRLLTGKLPDAIVHRGKGPGFAPDYMFRLRTEAEAARAHIALFRRAGADEWIDLEALDRGLARAARGATADYSEAARVQLTALAGAFFAWWRGLL
jgi:asparagine synthase (glutamine-hydrolysing)